MMTRATVEEKTVWMVAQPNAYTIIASPTCGRAFPVERTRVAGLAPLYGGSTTTGFA
jgi:hypothetical protein